MNRDKRMRKEILYYDSIDSTNLEAKRRIDQGAKDGTLIVAKMQTGGRGRRGRSWYSKPGDSLLMSQILQPPILPQQASMLTLVQALSVRKAVEKITGKEAKIKWPNDILLEEKKVCGILTELFPFKEGFFVVIGTGVNVNQEEFPKDIEAIAISMRQVMEENHEIEIDSVQEEISIVFEEYYHRFLLEKNLKSFREEYNTNLISKDRQVRVLDPKGEYEGKALGINERGELLVKTGEGEIREVSSGEVSVRGIYGYV